MQAEVFDVLRTVNAHARFINMDLHFGAIYNSDLEILNTNVHMIYQRRFNVTGEPHPVHVACVVLKDGRIFTGWSITHPRDRKNYSKYYGREIAVARAVGYAALSRAGFKSRVQHDELPDELFDAEIKDLKTHLEGIMVNTIRKQVFKVRQNSKIFMNEIMKGTEDLTKIDVKPIQRKRKNANTEVSIDIR
jgi:hypothetical protein